MKSEVKEYLRAIENLLDEQASQRRWKERICIGFNKQLPSAPKLFI